LDAHLADASERQKWFISSDFIDGEENLNAAGCREHFLMYRVAIRPELI
jgi:hypothetical protein